MQTKTLSRGTEIDTEKCVENMGNNRFNLVVAAAIRAREIGRRDREVTKYVNPVVTALKEVQEGKIGVEYLKKVR